MNKSSYNLCINFLKKATKKDTFQFLITFLAATFYITFPLLLDRHVLKMNDMSGNVANLIYVKKTLLEYGIFPQWNHLLNYGIPLVADPLNSFFSPVVFLSFLLFPLQISIKLIYFSSIFLSGIFFYLLLKKIKIERIVSLLLSFTFMSSGFMAARIYAGHLEKIITYPLYPLLLFSLINVMRKGGIKWIGVTSLILSLYIFSGAVYELLYAFITFSLIGLYYVFRLFITKKKIYAKSIVSMITVVLLTPFFSAVKILPLLEISPYIDHVRSPFSGSQNIFSFIFNLFLPNNEIFQFLGLQEKIDLPYFWWEHFAYIGVLPLICLILSPFIFRRITSKYTWLFIFLFFALISFSMLGSPFSPFHWLFKYSSFLEQFRIPSRIFIVLVPVILVLTAYVLNYFYRSGRHLIKLFIVLLLLLNFIDVSRAFYDKVGRNEFIYTPPVADLGNILNELEGQDNGYYYIGQSSLFHKRVPVDIAIHNDQRVKHNYGFTLRKSHSLTTESYTWIYPKYFIYPQGLKPPEYFTYKEIIIGSEKSKLYKNKSYTAFADVYNGQAKQLKNVSSTSSQIKKVSLEPDIIRVVVNSERKDNTLLILESYAPGWKAEVDGTEVEFLQNDFLNIPLKKGKHIYTFAYHNERFIIGLFITSSSFLLWVLYLLRSKIRKIYLKKQ